MLAACPLLALFLQQKALHCRSGDDKEMSSVISKASKRSPVSSSGGGLLKHGWRKETAARGAGSCCRALPAASRAPLARPRPGLPKPLQLQLPEGDGARVGSAAKRRAHDGHCPTHTGQNLKRTAKHEAGAQRHFQGYPLHPQRDGSRRQGGLGLTKASHGTAGSSEGFAG